MDEFVRSKNNQTKTLSKIKQETPARLHPCQHSVTTKMKKILNNFFLYSMLNLQVEAFYKWSSAIHHRQHSTIFHFLSILTRDRIGNNELCYWRRSIMDFSDPTAMKTKNIETIHNKSSIKSESTWLKTWKTTQKHPSMTVNKSAFPTDKWRWMNRNQKVSINFLSLSFDSSLKKVDLTKTPKSFLILTEIIVCNHQICSRRHSYLKFIQNFEGRRTHCQEILTRLIDATETPQKL